MTLQRSLHTQYNAHLSPITILQLQYYYIIYNNPINYTCKRTEAFVAEIKDRHIIDIDSVIGVLMPQWYVVFAESFGESHAGIAVIKTLVYLGAVM